MQYVDVLRYLLRTLLDAYVRPLRPANRGHRPGSTGFRGPVWHFPVPGLEFGRSLIQNLDLPLSTLS